MWVLVTYDLNSMWIEVKAAALKAGFIDYVPFDDGSRFKLPNTTLQVDATTTNDAMTKFKNVVRSVSPNIVMSALELSSGAP
jgi:hypothetical protein